MGKAAELLSRRMLPETVVGPEYVLAAVNSSQPPPVTTSPAVPLPVRMEPIEALEFTVIVGAPAQRDRSAGDRVG